MPSLSQPPQRTTSGPTIADRPSTDARRRATSGDGRGNAYGLERLRGEAGAGTAASGVAEATDGPTQAPSIGPRSNAGTPATPHGDQSLSLSLKAGKVFGVGDRGPAVTELQRLLGLSAGGQSGVYGPTTEAAVKEFQSAHSIEANGRVGPTTFKALTAPKAVDAKKSAPIIDQYRMNNQYNGGFCGIATLLSTLEAMGAKPNVDIRNEAQLERFSRGIYTPGQGSSGAAMAEKMRSFGRQNATFTTSGSFDQLMKNLVKGEPVPVGFVSMGGTVVAAPKASVRYGSAAAVGRTHFHKFGASGHWATVVGFEGDPKSPTHLLVNDSDTGARLRMTRAEFERHSDARTGIWMIPH